MNKCKHNTRVHYDMQYQHQKNDKSIVTTASTLSSVQSPFIHVTRHLSTISASANKLQDEEEEVDDVKVEVEGGKDVFLG